jgi:hypothetical protein
MLERFVAKLIEQSLDELRFKNFSIIAPLSSTKIDNLCRSIFGANQVVIDFDKEISSTDICVLLTNGKDDGVVILKNIHKCDSQNLRYLTEVLSKRTLSLDNGDDGTVEIPLSECPIVLVLAERHDLDNRLVGFFNFWIEISSSNLPEPLEHSEHEDEDNDNDDYLRRTVGEPDHQGLTDYELSEWAYAQRTPRISADLEKIRCVIQNECDDSECSGNGYNYDGMLNVCEKYIRYVEQAFERKILNHKLDLLCKKDGLFKDTLLSIYNQNEIDLEREAVTDDEFVANDDAAVSFNQLLYSIEINGDCRQKKEFLHQMLSLINDEYDKATLIVNRTISDLSEDEIDSTLIEELKRACWRIKLGDEYDPAQINSYSDDSSVEVLISLRVEDFEYTEISEPKLYFSVSNDDVETLEHLREFAETGNHKSLCYIVYHMIAVPEEERGGSGFKYYSKSDDMIGAIHNSHMLAEYKIRINSISIDGQKHHIPEECTNYEWYNLLEAFPNPGGLMSISPGYGSYKGALSEIDEFGGE